MSSESPWRIRDFRTLFTATALTQLGTNIGYVALPLIAVAALDASAGQVGALATLGTLAFLVIGLPAGAWVDRMRHRRVLVVADLVKAALYASVPLAWWLGGLTLWQLYAVALLSGCATVFYDVASQSVLPQLVGRDHLVQANAAVVGLMAVGNIAGRGAGGALVQLLTAPAAVAATAVSHLGSALRLIALRDTPAPAPAAPRVGAPGAPGLGAQIGRACGTSSATPSSAPSRSPQPSPISASRSSTPCSRSCSSGNSTFPPARWASSGRSAAWGSCAAPAAPARSPPASATAVRSAWSASAWRPPACWCR